MHKHMPHLLAIVIITLAVTGIAFYEMNRQTDTSAYSNGERAESNDRKPTPKNTNTTSSTSTDTSNAGLNTDLQNIDNQMKGLSDDSAKLDQSANP